MDQDFFEISSPKDMLHKATREFRRMQENLNTDNIFNFFVTAWHVQDYVLVQMGWTTGKPLPKIIKDLRTEADIQRCRFICDKGKHLKVTADHHKKFVKSDELKHRSGALGMAGMGKFAIGEGPKNKLMVNGVEEDVIQLGEKILALWEAFLKKHGLS